IAMVFQNYALYPHMSVFDNMAYGLKIAKVPVAEIKTRVDKAAAILELSQLLQRKPRELSGGQRQRVAMGRAIVRQPQVFLFDEPLSNLDAKLRAQTRLEIQKLHRELGITSLFVTHDQVEAMTLAQRIIVMNGGVMDQFATPEEVYSRPATTFVASFIGSPPMNLLRHAPGVRPGQILGIRPEHMALDERGWSVQVEQVELLGAERLVYGRIGDEQIIMRTDEADQPPMAGDTVKIAAREDKLHWFDAGSGKRAE
ncbi:ATP-binding cassette domain-containing protein, partial [Variovorax sp.]|uniref:ATP-binding cassette domain-containing protein n=1 Tax=Variovorax sp. TaxID=1871043 RepID=UPI0037DA44BD